MVIEFDKINPSTSLEAITEFETAWNVVLPDDYKEFLLKTNGGRLPRRGYKYIRYGIGYADYAHIDELYGIKSAETNLYTQDIHSANHKLEDYRLPDTIAIGGIYDGHWYFGIVVGEDRFGEVLLWLDGLPTFEYAHKLADSFIEFLEKITDNPEPDE
jgi:hypothetical protein